jgi:hypothetical protein
MQAIQTRYHGPTNTLGARIKASCERGSLTIPYPYELSGDEVHREAALQLIERFVSEDWRERSIPPSKNPWKRAFVTGGLPDGTYAHVFDQSPSEDVISIAREAIYLALAYSGGESETAHELESQLDEICAAQSKGEFEA